MQKPLSNVTSTAQELQNFIDGITDPQDKALVMDAVIDTLRHELAKAGMAARTEADRTAAFNAIWPEDLELLA